jgi:NDP-sugar pyrophosphorylase family protein
MWGIIPAAGIGSRIQPLAFSKELLPVGSRTQENMERPRAISEYLVERLILGGADRICFVISPGKSDILEYYAKGTYPANFCYVVQPNASGLCDALFRRPDDSSKRYGRHWITGYRLVSGGRVRRASGRSALIPVVSGRPSGALRCRGDG